jgi:hypothetical protein
MKAALLASFKSNVARKLFAALFYPRPESNLQRTATMSTSKTASTSALMCIPYKPLKLCTGMMDDSKLRMLLDEDKVCVEIVKSQLNIDELRGVVLLNRLSCGGAAGISQA